jgi:hypothetical protein
LAEFEGLLAGGGEGLVDDDVFARFERLPGQREVRLIGCGDDHQLDGLVGEEIVE